MNARFASVPRALSPALQGRRNMKKFYRRPLFLVLSVILVIVLVLAFSAKGPGDQTYTEDYAVKYADELKEIFGDHSVGPRREVNTVSESGDWAWHFSEWTVVYRDACGREMECTLNNYEALPAQQLRWLADQVEQHFYTDYIVPFFGSLIDQGNRNKTYCSCSIGRVCNSMSSSHPEWRSQVDTCSAYQDTLKGSEPPIPLYKLGYAEILDRYPVLLTVQITLTDFGYSQPDWKLIAGGKLKRMASAMSDENGGNLNLDAFITRPSFDDEETLRCTYLMGQETEMDPLDHEHAVFEAYKGKFW